MPSSWRFFWMFFHQIWTIFQYFVKIWKKRVFSGNSQFPHILSRAYTSNFAKGIARSLDFLKNVPALECLENFSRGRSDTFKVYGIFFNVRAFQRTNFHDHIISRIDSRVQMMFHESKCLRLPKLETFIFPSVYAGCKLRVSWKNSFFPNIHKISKNCPNLMKKHSEEPPRARHAKT